MLDPFPFHFYFWTPGITDSNRYWDLLIFSVVSIAMMFDPFHFRMMVKQSFIMLQIWQIYICVKKLQSGVKFGPKHRVLPNQAVSNKNYLKIYNSV